MYFKRNSLLLLLFTLFTARAEHHEEFTLFRLVPKNPVKFNLLVGISFLITAYVYVPLPLNVLVHCHPKVARGSKSFRL